MILRLTFKNAMAKKVRLLSTASSIILAVAFLAGTLVFTDTIRRTFDDLFADIYENTEAVVRSSSGIDVEFGGGRRGRISDALIDDVRAVDGVVDAQGLVQGYAQIVDAGGDAIGDPGRGAPTMGMSYVSGAVSPWQLTEGSRAPKAGELVVDKGSADRGDLAIGDTVTVLTQTGTHDFELVGTARFGSADSPGGASVALWNLDTAQEVLLGETGEVDMIFVDAAPGLGETEMAQRLFRALPEGVEAVTGTKITEEAQDSIADALGFFNTFLLVFAVIGLVVACFTIYNTFQIIVTQRIREMALLRAIGASTRQVLTSQMVEAALIGFVASIIGLLAGVAIAILLKAAMTASGLDMPSGDIVFSSRTVLVSLAVGMVVTLVSAIFPARRASRVAPIAAIREVAIDQSAHSRTRLVEATVLTLAGAGAMAAGLAGQGVLWVGVGALLVLIGAFVFGPLIARPAVKLLGAPLPAASGVVGELAKDNALRNPKRTARTGGALMVGVALVATITVLTTTAKDWTHDVFSEQFTGDLVVSTSMFEFGGLSPQLTVEIQALPEVEAATGVRTGLARVLQLTENDEAYVAVEPATAGAIFDIGMNEGSLADLTDHGVLLFEDEASSRGIGVGDTLEFSFLNGTSQELTVEGTYSQDALAGDFVVSHAVHESSGMDQFDFSVYVQTAPGVSEDEARAAITPLTDAFPNAEVQSRSEYIAAQSAEIDQLANLMYSLLALAVVIGISSIANTMALSIHERTRELGLLRAVGMTRHQTKTAIRWEAVLVALIGTGLGLLIGLFFGWSISVTLRDEGLTTFNVSPVALIVIVVCAVLAGLLAAFRPARQAARLDILKAIASE